MRQDSFENSCKAQKGHIISDIQFRYQTKEFKDFEIQIRTLLDKNQFSDDEGLAEELGISSAQWPLFGVIWPAGEVLAHVVDSLETEGKRILEVGCGIGLPSLVLAKKKADITASDYHPEAGQFLAENMKLNHCESLPFFQANWMDLKPDMGKFNLIIASDVLYEIEQAKILAHFINFHAEQQCEVIMTDPGRKHHKKFTIEMEKLNFVHSEQRSVPNEFIPEPFKGFIHKYVR